MKVSGSTSTPTIADADLQARVELLRRSNESSAPAKGEERGRQTRSTAAQSAPVANEVELVGRHIPKTSPKREREESQQEAEDHIHPELRARPQIAPAANMMSAPIPPAPPAPPAPVADPALDMGSPQSGDPMDDSAATDGRKAAKRELSQSKRAAQNRAAQRAFRQRKEGYIKKLEQQVRDSAQLEQNFKTTQAENYALREYVIHLQSRLIESQGDYPQPPPNVDLSQPIPSASNRAPEPTSNAVTATPLDAAAQAVASLVAAGRRFQDEGKPQISEDARTAEEINQQLRNEAP